MRQVVLLILVAVSAFGAKGVEKSDGGNFPTVFGFPVVSSRENAYAFQISVWTLNCRLYGVQISPVLGLSDKMYGLQVAVGGNLANHVRGVQLGVFNEAQESICGLQVGVVNKVRCQQDQSPSVFVQLGLMNFFEDEQTGERDIFAALPILRVHW